MIMKHVAWSKLDSIFSTPEVVVAVVDVVPLVNVLAVLAVAAAGVTVVSKAVIKPQSNYLDIPLDLM